MVEHLKNFFLDNPKIALAFSGGTDSSYLLYAAKIYKCDIHAYYVKTPFQPEFELDDVLRLSKKLDVPVTILNIDILSYPRIVANGDDRCYLCKKIIFSSILNAAKKDGYTLLIDGTNASDNSAERPGMKALEEMAVRSPLKECGIDKMQIRRLLKDCGLSIWDKPAYACLATRILDNGPINEQILKKVEHCEDFISAVGFKDFRVRVKNQCAIIQIREEDFDNLIKCRDVITSELNKYFNHVFLDLKER